jgi:hypothetical protein
VAGVLFGTSYQETEMHGGAKLLTSWGLGRKEKKGWGPNILFKDMPPMTYLPSIGPTSSRFHHLPVAPQLETKTSAYGTLGNL